MRPYFLTFLLSSFLCTCVSAQKLELFESFTNHAVLQRNTDHPMWGWAKPGTVVKVLIGEQKLSVKTDKSGRWEVSLPPMPAGGPHKISVQAKNEGILLEDVYFGDVYLLSGQSNMEWRLSQSDADGSRAKAIADPLIRELKVKRAYDGSPRTRLDIDEKFSEEWIVGTAAGIKDFSAVGSYFAHYLREEVDVPVGLLHSSWGGSRIEPWMRPTADGMNPDLDETEDMMAQAGIPGRKRFAQDFPGRNVPTEDNGQAKGWLTDDFDAASWPTMTLPTFWERAGYPNVDGVFYFRRSFSLTEAQAAGAATLYLGAIDDGDITHINGEFVGTHPDAHAAKRRYEVPAGTLRAGRNTIAIRVNDGGGGGGFSAEAEGMKLETAKGSIPLAGGWKFNIGEFSVGGNFNKMPVILYNAMIAPLAKYPLTGILWYQGESNAGPGDNVNYAQLMKGLIKDWRDFFANPDLPFYWVQLANYTAPPASANEPGWAVLRRSQTEALELPFTGQAVITDIGEAGEIHPQNKWEVGRRLSLHALKDIYDKDVVASSPAVSSAKVINDRVVVRFSGIGGGLVVRPNAANDQRYPYLAEGFTVEDANGKWHFASGLVGEDDNGVVLITPPGITVRRVRYAWASNPERANLFSREGLPVTPFEISVD
ncbi:hypothetical protein FUA23_02805 [Neolewinella aurantiaca]|uniref:Sialate O-acetylesterase domain-containing protein n=1 Tax=Neolewinella aurantiaca TaxID=2602767 RepID=A0A5C7FJ11_9BACT|nr:sialate O-acetylesterase [Neolewinella aurantiaca]TXF91172.1 hypothetical protein FUA23_02805 [Neolewinella aurantiaca]